MKVAVVYVFPQVDANKYQPMARRFVQEYLNHPPGETDHDLYVCVNGGARITAEQEALFDPLVPTFIQHNNAAKDLGAYLLAARTLPCDFLICLGSPARPRLTGWLDALVTACENNGPGIYAPWGFHVPSTHLRTTVFAISPNLLSSYPYPINNGTRYEFEHGKNGIAVWCVRRGFQALQVTTRGVFDISHWYYVPVAESYFLDQHCDRDA